MMEAMDTKTEIYGPWPASSTPYEELTPEQREYVDSDDYMDVLHAAMAGWGRERIAGDMRKDMWFARVAVAATTSDEDLMEKLSHDPDQHVRAALAERGLFPDRMAEDRSLLVRTSLAESRDRRPLLNDSEPESSIQKRPKSPTVTQSGQVKTHSRP